MHICEPLCAIAHERTIDSYFDAHLAIAQKTFWLTTTYMELDEPVEWCEAVRIGPCGKQEAEVTIFYSSKQSWCTF